MMKKTLLLSLILLNLQSYATVPVPDFQVSVSQSCPYQDITITNTSTITGNIISYNWTFENGIPSSYTGQNPPLIQWEREGAFEIKLEIVYNCTQEDPVDPHGRMAGGEESESCAASVSLTKSIIIDARCCPNLPILSAWSPGNVIDKVYKVDNDLVLTNGTYEINGGSLLFEGIAVPDPNGNPGGTVEGPYIFTYPSARLDIQNGHLKSYCGAMWGGIAISGGNSIVMKNSNFEDAYDGIFYLKSISAGNAAYDFDFDENIFRNNFKGVFAEDVGSFQNITNNTFTCEPGALLSPLNINDANNTDELFRSRYSIYTGKYMSLFQGEVHNNIFENHMVGIAVFPSTGFGAIHVTDCEFINNTLAASFIDGTETASFGGCTFEIPGTVDENYQFNIDKMLFCPAFGGPCSTPTIYDEFSVGIYLKTMSTNFEVLACNFTNLYNSTSDIFTTSRPVLGLRSPDTYPLTVTGTEFNNFDEAIRVEGSNPMTINENIFYNCIKSINIDNDPGSGISFSLSMTCNHFKQPFDHSFNRYGLFLTNGSQLNDIGGDNSFPNFVMPNGNGFPADPDFSAGYDPDPNVACFGGSCAGNVGDWQVPSGWYSIWDDNATSNSSMPTFQYYRYENEFVGDLNNQSSNLGVYPGASSTPLVVDALIEANMYNQIITNPPPTCANVQSIPFPPLPRLSGDDEVIQDLFEVEINPNPVKNSFISIKSNSEIEAFTLSDVSGKNVTFTIKKVDNNIYKLSPLTSLKNGVYILLLTNSKGNSKQFKIIVE